MFLYSITETGAAVSVILLSVSDTLTGLEIFTMRATKSSFDDKSMPTTKPCIIGIQPFNGLKTLIVERDTLVLLCL